MEYPYLLNTKTYQDFFVQAEMREISQKWVDAHISMPDEKETLSEKTRPLQDLLMAVTKMYKK